MTFTNKKLNCDVSISKNVDMTYGLLPKSEYYVKPFVLNVHISNLSVDSRSIGEYIVEYTYKNYTGTETDTLNNVSGVNADSHIDELNFDVTITKDGIFKMRELPVGAIVEVTEYADVNYIISCNVHSNTGAVIQVIDKTNESVIMPLSMIETIDSSDSDIEFEFLNDYRFDPYVLPSTGYINMTFVLFELGFVLFVSTITYSHISHKKRKYKI